jgi:hypothetical protein
MMNKFTAGDSQTVARKKIRKNLYCKKFVKAKNIFYVPEAFLGPNGTRCTLILAILVFVDTVCNTLIYL